MFAASPPAGLHDLVAGQILPRFVRPGERAVDLGHGSGALAVRLRALGLNAQAADINAEMDERSEPAHISPIFWDLFVRQYLPRAALELMEHGLYPPRGYNMTRSGYAWALRGLGWVLGGDCLHGDNHILILRPQGKEAP